MAHGFKPINVLPDGDQLKRNVGDANYWARMKESSIFEEYNIISSVAFMPTLPHHLAITSSNKALVFDTSISQPVWTQSSFKSDVHGIKFRKDGLMMGMGSTDGYVRLYSIEQKNIPAKHPIRLFKAHDSEVRTLAFPSSQLCATLADDGDIRLWDISTTDFSKPLWEVKGAHSDRILAASTSAVSDNLLISGSYDHTIKLWDVRGDSANGPLVSIDHGFPVETLLFHSNNRIVVSGGGNVVKFWDISSGINKPVKVLNDHAKTVTSLCFSNNARFLLSGGLDRRIHTYRIDRGDFALVHTFETADLVLSLDIAGNNECMGFGMNKTLCIYRRHPKQHVFADETTNKVLIGDGKRVEKARQSVVYHQERGAEAVKLEITAKHVDQLHLGTFDKMLRKHQYRKMVDQAFSNKELLEKKPNVIVAVLDQIRLSGNLQIAFSGRQGRGLGLILKFIARNLFYPAYFDILYDIINVIIVMYAEETLNQEECGTVAYLKNQINAELLCERRLLYTLGIMKSMINVSFAQSQGSSEASDSAFGDLLIKPKLFTLKDSSD